MHVAATMLIKYRIISSLVMLARCLQNIMSIRFHVLGSVPPLEFANQPSGCALAANFAYLVSNNILSALIYWADEPVRSSLWFTYPVSFHIFAVERPVSIFRSDYESEAKCECRPRIGK